MRVSRFEDLIAWQKARELASAVYRATRLRELRGDYALVRQMQRAAISIAANIAEGFGREGAAELHRFVVIARGSCFELLSHVYIAADIGYLTPDEQHELTARIDELSRILRGLRQSIDAKRH